MIAIERAVLPGVRSEDFDLIQFAPTQRICAVDVENFLIVSGLMTLNNLGDRGTIPALRVQHEPPLGVGQAALRPGLVPPVVSVVSAAVSRPAQPAALLHVLVVTCQSFPTEIHLHNNL